MFDIIPITFVIDYDIESFEYDFEEFLNFYLSKSAQPAVDIVSIELLRRKNYYRTLHEKDRV